MATVIYSNMGDTDTKVLEGIWQNIPNINVVEIKRNTINARELVNEAIQKEDDLLIFTGHGLPEGLLNSSLHGGTFLLDSRNVQLVHAKKVIGVWCYASSFAEYTHLKGFFSSMFISNAGEARANNCYRSKSNTITEQEILFCERLNKLILTETPMDKWVQNLKDQADMNIDIVNFNYNGLRYFS